MKRKKKSVLVVILFMMFVIILTGCIPGDGASTVENPAGFFWGIWHGWIAPLSLIIGIFNNEIRVYEAINSGWWYDLGFYIAVISGFGGLSFVRNKKKD